MNLEFNQLLFHQLGISSKELPKLVPKIHLTKLVSAHLAPFPPLKIFSVF
jgi:hypothetical protein